MSAIYIVNGFTGMYEDRESWIEGAYQTHKEAMGRTDELNNRLIVLGCYDSAAIGFLGYDRCTELGDAMRGEDALFRCDYNGAHYSYERVELKKWVG